MTFTLRPMHRADLDVAIAWAAAEGWQPGLGDGDSFYATDPHGFWLGELGGKPISCISAVAYNNCYGFVGFYIVHPDYRGQGYGWQTWQHALAYLRDRQMGLDGVVAQQANYQKSGFEVAYRNIRYSAQFSTLPEPQEAAAVDVVPASTLPFDQLMAFDATYFPAARPTFLQHWLQQPNALAAAVVERGTIQGYGMIRPCHQGWRIGPLFATTPPVAETLLRQFLRHGYAKPCFWDIPEPNLAALALAAHYGFTPCFETARMYKNGCPNLPLEGIFGVTTLELG
ncbi:GNAT family N-acetyltransferase [Thermosynechococcaceae cyanobacterium Okahandja]